MVYYILSMKIKFIVYLYENPDLIRVYIVSEIYIIFFTQIYNTRTDNSIYILIRLILYALITLLLYKNALWCNIKMFKEEIDELWIYKLK